MNDKMNEIFNKAKKITFSNNEKETIRASLNLLMRQNKIVDTSVNDFKWLIFLSKHSISAALIVIFFVSGTTTVLADKAMPGDVLYPVKIDLSEKILGFFARSPQAKASWQLTLAERRLDEVEHLAKNPEGDKRREEAKNRLEVEAENTKKLVSAWEGTEESDSEVVTNSMQIATKSAMPQKSVFMAVSSSLVVPDEDESKEIERIKESIKNERKNISELRKNLKDKLKESPKDVIGLRGKLLFADKAYFDAEEALSSGDIISAKNHFERAGSILENVNEKLFERTNENQGEKDVLIESADTHTKVEDLDNSNPERGAEAEDNH